MSYTEESHLRFRITHFGLHSLCVRDKETNLPLIAWSMTPVRPMTPKFFREHLDRAKVEETELLSAMLGPLELRHVVEELL